MSRGLRTGIRPIVLASIGVSAVLLSGRPGAGQTAGTAASAKPSPELPVKRIPVAGEAAEAYFSPDSRSVICNAKLEGDTVFHVYTFGIDGKNVRKINGKGDDACSFYFPDGKKLIWTSTKDRLDLPHGNYSDPADYPQGAELYTSDLEGGNVVRLTSNEQYDAEVSVSPDGQWILFARQVEGRLDLYKMRSDGSGLFQITKTPDWQEGGAQWMPDGKRILFRAWKIEDQGKKKPLPMTVFLINADGTGLTALTSDPGTNWAPFPAPDNRHFVYVKVLPPRNFEIFLRDIPTGEEKQLTFHDAFDGFPALSPDGRWLAFSSARAEKPGETGLHLYLMDVQGLNIGPAAKGK
jgi:Tol biopolymer transport system component